MNAPRPSAPAGPAGEPIDFAAEAAAATPVMAQFFEAKALQPDALVFFRMGDFYELFFDDAVRAATALGIALSYRGKHAGADIPMAGVPAHAADAYLARLIQAGFKVAVCEQMEDPRAARARGSRAIVRREVVRIVTPGTLTEEVLLDARGANRLCAVAVRGAQAALAAVELSTGEVEVGFVARGDLAAAIAAAAPSELLVPDRLFADEALAAVLKNVGAAVQPLPGALADPDAGAARLKRLYAVATLDAFGDFAPVELSALGLIAAHLETTQVGRTPALQPPRRAGVASHLVIDPATRASLEIDRDTRGGRDGALLGAVDRTLTPAGARALAERLARPLVDAVAIDARLDAVAWLAARPRRRAELRAALRPAGDMGRSLSRLVLQRGTPRDLAAIRAGLGAGGVAAACVAATDKPDGDLDPGEAAPGEIDTAIAALALAAGSALADVLGRLERGLEAEPPANARDGGFVRAGFDAALDAARTLRDDSRRVVAALEARLQGETGLPLRVRHNAVLGYFIDATARQAETLASPPWSTRFIHRQTTAGQVRFTTAELAELDARIGQAADRAQALEAAVFEALRAEVCAVAAAIQAAARALAELDVAAALAEWAEDAGAVRPRIDGSTVFEVEGARHPVVEAAVRAAGQPYTPNDARLDGEGVRGPRLAIVTGPNMAGKSTFLRQNALLVVLAQAGSFVPARRLHLGVVDRLFSRVGAGDDLARGRSTFMAEMVETAAILQQATPRSFVVLDEIGRGTATYDGLAIAWACAEALHDVNRARTLFATHYHELARLEDRLAHVCNLSMRAKEWNGDLVFLHEAAPGAADRSYGVAVAKLAGVPPRVVARARQVLARLERSPDSPARLEDLPLFAAAAPLAPEYVTPSPLEHALAELDPDTLTPREALEALYRLKASLRS